MIASDHSPAPPELKQGSDAFAWWGGISGVQTLRGTFVAAASERGLLPPDLARLTAGAAAGRFSLRSKGRLEVGRDADLTLVDLDDADVVRDTDLLYRHRQGPFDGCSVLGRVVRTMLRGSTVIDEGRVVAGAAFGRIVRPS